MLAEVCRMTFPAAYNAVHEVGSRGTSRKPSRKALFKGKMEARRLRVAYDRRIADEVGKSKPLCPTCKTNPKALTQSTCLPCKAKYMRERRKQTATDSAQPNVRGIMITRPEV